MKKWIYTAVLLLLQAHWQAVQTTEDTGREQRYAYPLATASPEDTVTQIYARKFERK